MDFAVECTPLRPLQDSASLGSANGPPIRLAQQSLTLPDPTGPINFPERAEPRLNKHLGGLPVTSSGKTVTIKALIGRDAAGWLSRSGEGWAALVALLKEN
jgi:hypothetical protein